MLRMACTASDPSGVQPDVHVEKKLTLVAGKVGFPLLDICEANAVVRHPAAVQKPLRQARGRRKVPSLLALFLSSSVTVVFLEEKSF